MWTPILALVGLLQTPAPGIVLDGRLADWPEGATALADADYVYLRIALPEEVTPQGGQLSTRLSLDLDGKDSTGRKADGLGVDLEIVLSPPSPEAGKGLRPGVAVRAIDDRGIATDVGHAALDFAFAPTVATRALELRIGRNVALGEPVGSRWRSAARLAGRADFARAGGAAVRGADGAATFALDLPPRREARALATAAIPPRPEGAVRALTWNVLKEAPAANPAPFARVLAAAAPDVVLLQEWKSTSEELAAWFDRHAAFGKPWHAHTFPGTGVAVVSRLPLTPLGKAPLTIQHDGKERPVRYVAARLDSPLGPLVASSVHLKCCGSKGTREDLIRQAEAAAINEQLRAALAASPDSALVLTGDMNLVGTALPLDQIRAGLDRDGSDLDLVDAGVLGDSSNYTWSNPGEAFAPGRLDYAVYSDSAIRAAGAFVIDTLRLSDAALAAAKLERADSEASDHRPVVFDLAPKQEQKSSQAGPPLESVDSAGVLAAVRAAGASGAKGILVNLWATWCKPCVAELPDLLRVKGELAGDGLAVLLVSCDFDEQAGRARALLDRLGCTDAQFRKGEPDDAFIAGLAPEWSGALPATIAFGPGGEKIAFHEGEASYQDFLALARQALREPASRR